MNALSRAFLFVFLAITAAFGVFSVPAAEGQNPPVLRIERPDATDGITVVEGGTINFVVYAMNVSGSQVTSDIPLTLSCDGGAHGTLGNCEATIPMGSNSVEFDVRIPDDNIDNTQSSFDVSIVDEPHYNLSARGTSGAPTPTWIQPIVDDEDVEVSFLWRAAQTPPTGTGGVIHELMTGSQRTVHGFFKIQNNSPVHLRHLLIEEDLNDFIPSKNFFNRLQAAGGGDSTRTNCHAVHSGNVWYQRNSLGMLSVGDYWR